MTDRRAWSWCLDYSRCLRALLYRLEALERKKHHEYWYLSLRTQMKQSNCLCLTPLSCLAASVGCEAVWTKQKRNVEVLVRLDQESELDNLIR